MPGPLKGVKVIAFDQVVAAPACTAVLADWGADVIKVEPPWGEFHRNVASAHLAQMLLKYPSGEIEVVFEYLNRNKRGVVLDLRKDKAREILYRFLQDTDIFVTNYSVDVLEKFGVDYSSLKERFPKLIYCLLTGYGSKGPKKGERGYDWAAAWTYGGVAMSTGEPDSDLILQPPGMMDMVTSAHLLGGICAALYNREKTGKGQSLETSLYNVAVWSLLPTMAQTLLGHPFPSKFDRLRQQNPLWNIYRSMDDRWVMLVNMFQASWAPFCLSLNKPDWIEDPKYNTVENRATHCEELIREIDQIMATQTMDEWEHRFRANDVIFAIAQTPSEVLTDEQSIANGFFTEMEHPVTNKIRYLNSTIKFSETPAMIAKVAPRLGEHTEEVLLEHGYTREDIGELKKIKAIP